MTKLLGVVPASFSVEGKCTTDTVGIIKDKPSQFLLYKSNVFFKLFRQKRDSLF